MTNIGDDIKFSNEYVLWTHDIYDKDWSINGYSQLCNVDNVSTFWRLFNNFNKLDCVKKHYYLMKKNIEPIWEHPENRNGGICTLKVDYNNLMNIWELLCAYMVCNELCEMKDDINGVSLSPKSNWVILKIWNKNKKNNLAETLNDHILKTCKNFNVTYKQNIPEY